MAVSRLNGENFRLYQSIAIEPHCKLNLIVGANAEGKTSLIEAIYAASRGRSFRTPNLGELAAHSHESWALFMEVEQARSRHRVGIAWSKAGVQLRFDEQRGAKVADLVRAVPLQLIDPLSHRLLDEGPAYRRSFVDWGVFHVEPRFLETWRRYQRALKQRNAALRGNTGFRSVTAWNEELATQAESLARMRLEHVRALSLILVPWVANLLGRTEVHCEWDRGWPENQSYLETLEGNFEQHQRANTTVQGPHRAELRVLLAGERIKAKVSRGEQKMLVAALVLGQAELLIHAGVSPPIILIDDFSAELAPTYQARLAEGLMAYPGQKFISAFEIPSSFKLADGIVFHVEHGAVQPGQQIADRVN